MKSFDEWYETIDDCAFDDVIHAMGSAFEAGQQSKQTEVDELKKRIDERDKLINDFISDLGKTENEDLESIHDYWRGFSSCAGAVKDVLIERFNVLKGESNET